jgi:hypothetical protein
MTVNYIIWIGLLVFFIIIITNHFFNKKREGASVEVYSTTSSPSVEVYSVVCKESPMPTISETNTDSLVNKAANDYLSTVAPLLKDYINKLQAISDKFNNISSALSIGSIDISSPQTDPIVVINSPVDDKIEQVVNFIMPKGSKGKEGPKPNLVIDGPRGPQGGIGEQGEDGKYMVIQQQKDLPNKVRSLQ